MHILDLLFPKRCVGCRRIGAYFCHTCQKSIAYTQLICPVCEKPAIDGRTHPKCQTRYTLDGLTSFFHYDGIIRQAIKTVKYRLVSDLAQEFIGLIPSSSLQLPIHNYQSSIFIPIPLHPEKKRFRGFNQTEVLGRILAKRLGVSVRSDILKRVIKTLPQVEMKERKKRLKNMEGVFAVNQLAMKQYNNETILLFDDVFTTGATLRSAASVLKRAGAKKVWGIVLAHG